MTADQPPAEPKRRRWQWRWWLLGTIALGSAALIAFIQLFPPVAESGLRVPLTIFAGYLTAGLHLLWLLIASGLRWWIRLGGLAAAIACVVAFNASVRTVGYTGNILPIYDWTWNPLKDETLPPLKSLTTSDSTRIERPVASAAGFPQFLGEHRDGVVSGVTLDVDWSAHPPREVWRRPIGAGWSGFAVAGNDAVTQEQRGPDELVVCYDLATGEPRWASSEPVRFSENLGGDGPRATPTLVDGQVYAIGATGILNCIDLQSGAHVWRKDTLAEAGHKNLMWGKSCSPLVFDDLVVVTLGESSDRPLAAYYRTTGNLAWRGGDAVPSYASPVLATLAGYRQIVTVNAESVSGHDPKNGNLLWKHPWVGTRAPKSSQPRPVGEDELYISSGYNDGSALLKFRPGKTDSLAVDVLWSAPRIRTKLSNVAVHEGLVYGLDEGILECQELATGARRWKQGRYGHGQILLVGDVLLIQTEPGDVVLVETNPDDLVELARLPALSSKTWNNPALAGRFLLVRNAEEAACFELPVVDATVFDAPAVNAAAE